MNYIPNTTSEVFSLSAIVVAYLLIDDTTAWEQNALGNWFMLLGQTLVTNATHLQVLNERGIKKANPYASYSSSFFEVQNHIAMLEKTITALQQQVGELKMNFPGKTT